MPVRDTFGRSEVPFSETRRQIVHLAMGAFALLLRDLAWWQAALAAVTAFLFNLILLPRLGGRWLYRPADRSRGYPLGILIYPLSVLLLILALPNRLDLAAAGWGILAAGDSAATLVGRRVGGPRLPWNGDKSVAGSLAFAVCGSAAGIALALWVRPAVTPVPAPGAIVAATVAAAVVAALVESLPVGLDDNISVPIGAGLVLLGAQNMTWNAWLEAWPTVRSSLAGAVLLNVPAATVGWLARTVTPGGAVVGALIGILVFATTGAGGWVLLFASFFAAAASSKLGLKRKSVLGIAEAHGGQRGPGNAIANCGLAAWAGILAVTTPHREIALLAFVAALAAGGSDTVASEIGKAWGSRTYSVPRFARVRPGTSGAVSLEGTAAGLVAALGLAAVGQMAGLVHGTFVWIAAAGAFAASWVESALGSTLEAPGILDNDLLNFINTTVAAIVAVVLARMML